MALEVPRLDPTGAMDSITQGTFDSVKIMINIIAMFVILVALVCLANTFLGLFPNVIGEPLKLERVLGWVIVPMT